VAEAPDRVLALVEAEELGEAEVPGVALVQAQRPVELGFPVPALPGLQPCGNPEEDPARRAADPEQEPAADRAQVVALVEADLAPDRELEPVPPGAPLAPTAAPLQENG